MTSSIQVFAADHRQNIVWDLPYVRLGSPESDAVIKVKNSIADSRRLAEVAQIFWAYDHYNELGSPDYVGFCQYRRFFSNVPSRNCVMNFKDRCGISFAFSPLQQLCAIEKFKLDGIVPYPMLEDFAAKDLAKSIDERRRYSTLAEYFYQSLKSQNIGLSFDQVQYALSTLHKSSPDWLKPYMTIAFSKFPVHFCNTFTLSYDLFSIWIDMQKKTMSALSEYCGKELLEKIDCRALGYVAERTSSCILHAFRAAGKQLLNMPLVVVDCDASPSSRHKTAEEMNKGDANA